MQTWCQGAGGPRSDPGPQRNADLGPLLQLVGRFVSHGRHTLPSPRFYTCRASHVEGNRRRVLHCAIDQKAEGLAAGNRAPVNALERRPTLCGGAHRRCRRVLTGVY